MNGTKMDIVDLLINMLKEHEKNLDELSARMENTMNMIQQFSGHTLAEEKLTKLEEFIEFRKAEYEEGKVLGVHISTGQVLGDLEKILQTIRGEIN